MEESNLHTEELFKRYYSNRDWQSYRFLLADCVRFSRPGKILDLGCGLGYFLECAEKFGFEAIGIEGSPYAVKVCRQKGLNVYEQLLSEQFPFSDCTFSVVVANQIIEHTPSEVAKHMLRESYRVLEEDGIIVIQSPCRYNPSQRREETHINLYTPKSLFREVERVGFRVVDRSNSVRTFGLGKIGRCLARLLYAATDLDWFASSANCIAVKHSVAE